MTEVKLGICVPTAEMGRQAIFYDYFDQIIKPGGTLIMRPHGQSPARGRNIVIEAMLENQCTHILFIDDDTVPPPDVFTKLVAHNVDMVTGIYPMRNFPHQNIIFDRAESDGRCWHHWVEDGKGEGLIPLVAAGLGAVLIKTEVFRGMEKPWITLGELESDHWCDDISFFMRARKAGFKLFGDLSVRCGHMATVTVRNEYIDGKWITTYDTGGKEKVNFPMPRPVMETV